VYVGNTAHILLISSSSSSLSSSSSSSSMALQLIARPWQFFFFLVSWFYTQSVGLLGKGISPEQGLYLHTRQHKQNTRIQTTIPQVGLQPTNTVFELAKKIHDLERAATAIGTAYIYRVKMLQRRINIINELTWKSEINEYLHVNTLRLTTREFSPQPRTSKHKGRFDRIMTVLNKPTSM
jgi:hypothetical protein